MAWNVKLRIPSNVTALKWLFCFLTACLLSVVAFAMGLAISAMYFIREQMIVLVANDESFTRAYLLYGAFNTACASLAAVSVLYGATPASGSGLPVRVHVYLIAHRLCTCLWMLCVRVASVGSHADRFNLVRMLEHPSVMQQCTTVAASRYTVIKCTFTSLVGSTCSDGTRSRHC